MDSVFNTAEAPVASNVTTDEAANAKKEKLQVMKASLRETVQTDPTFAEKLHTLSASLKVVNTLGFGTTGNIVLDKKAAAADGERKLTYTGAICGYTVQNIGSAPIEYTTEEFAKDASGKFVGTVVSKTIAPGQTVQLSRMYMTMLCAKPEISFTLSNGKIVASSKKKVNSLKEELAAYYFTFSDGTQVNDDAVKLQVDKDGVVKPEYEVTFGYLNNPKEPKAARVKGTKFSAQDLAANYINSLIQNQGI